MEIIKIDIKEKIATNLSDTVIVCGNNDYFVEFTFDSEWENIKVKTARFYFNFKHIDIVFEGNTCQIPLLEETQLLRVGVFADNVKTTTDAEIRCVYSIKKYGGNVYEPSPDVYAQIMALLEKYIVEEKKYLTTEQVSELPTPSNDTLGKIYLLSSVNGNNNIYDEYITVEKAEGQFAWEKIGSVGFTLIVDDKLSNKSENPVQNKVIAKELENKVTLDTDQTITSAKTFTKRLDFVAEAGDINLYIETNENGYDEPVLYFNGPFGSTKIKRNTIINRNGGGDAQTFTFPEESGTIATIQQVNDKVGDIESALDSIIAIQNSLIGGNE